VADHVLQPDAPEPRRFSSIRSEASAGGALPLMLVSCQFALVGKGDS